MTTYHVVAEVFIDGRWMIVDPTFHAILTDRNGRLLTRQDLASPSVLREATRNLAGYNPAYNYEHTAFIHFSRLPLVGHFLQEKLSSVLPAWQERVNWAVLVERQSYATLVVGIALLGLAICLRRMICWYGRKLSIFPMNPWEQLREGGVALFSSLPFDKSERESFPQREIFHRQ
jgi:hypothetical protein